MTISPYGRHWAVYDDAGELVCLCVYKKGAREVVGRLEAAHRQDRQPSGRRWMLLLCQLTLLRGAWAARWGWLGDGWKIG